jgi:hypothetical protein
MRRVCLITISAVILVAALAPATASAQATRTWVSGVGDDANPCSRLAPCKTFAGAISKTAAGGEISVLDPGSFGALTITKTLTVNGCGLLAGTIASGGVSGITVNAGVNDKVILRCLAINGVGSGLSGVRLLAGKELTIEDSMISGFTSRGVDVAVPNGTTLNMKNVTISNVLTGVRVTSTTGSAVATLDSVSLNGLTTGLEVSTNGFALVRASTVNRNSTGVLVNASGATAVVEGCMVAFNGTALNASVSGAILRIADNGIYNNTAGIAVAPGATVASRGDNRVAGATADPTVTTIVK